MRFFNDTIETTVSVSGERDPTFSQGIATDSQLPHFLSRPIRIYEGEWAVGTPLADVELDPWNAYLTDYHVRQRIDHFKLLRANLNIKVVINGSPFHYGRAIAYYHPLPVHDSFSAIPKLTTDQPFRLLTYSQFPNIPLDPTTCSGGTMKMPFFYHKNFVDVPSGEWTQLGRLNITNVVNLQHANGGLEAVPFAVYVWLSEVELTVPTTLSTVPPAVDDKPVVVSGRYQSYEGPISSTAGLVENLSSKLTDAPMIGRYARATRDMASIAGKAAKMLGFSRPASLEDVNVMKPEFYGKMANTDLPENVAKLSLNSAQELSVDPSIVGLEGTDEMALKNIVQKEAILDTFSWSGVDAAEAFLWNSRVTPELARYATSTLRGNDMVAMTPMSHVAGLFKYWTGDIIFRFSVVATPYHRGRLRVTIDPDYLTSLTGFTNVVYTRIIDVSKEKEFEIKVNWMQTAGMLDVLPASASDPGYSGTTRFTTVSNGANGVITLQVLNPLVGPSVAPSDVSVVVYVRGGDNLRFISPRSRISPYTPFEESIQSEKRRLTGSNQSVSTDTVVNQVAELKDCNDECDEDACVGSMIEVDNFPLVYGGETVESFRALLKRYCFYRADSSDVSGGALAQSVTWRLPDFPMYKGYAFAAYDETATGIGYNYVRTTLMNYITPCYVARRGSIRYKVGAYGAEPEKFEVMVCRNGSLITAGSRRTVNTVAAITASITPRLSFLQQWEPINGLFVSPTKNNPVVEVELPFYSPYRFAFARSAATVGISADASSSMTHDIISVDKAAINTYYRSYVATGEDFSLFWYLSAPAFFVLPNP